MRLCQSLLPAGLLLLFACNVESKALDEHGAAVTSNPGSLCPDGVTVLLSDFFSTLIALADVDGKTQSGSFLSTGSSKTDGLAFALSGDVVLPSTRTPSGRVVLVDRFGTNVVTWADPLSTTVLGQLSVGTGFESNPTDYLELSGGRALVSRWGENSDPNRQAFDHGSDMLVVDAEAFRLVDSIEMPRANDLPPRPSSLSLAGDLVLVSLDRVSLDFATTGESELAALAADSLELEFVQPFAGLKGCGRPALSPNGQRLAVACGGSINRKGEIANLSESALVLLDATSRPFDEIQRFPAETLAGAALQGGVVFASEDLLLFKTQSALGGVENNRWLSLDVREQSLRTLTEAHPDAANGGKGVVYGGMVCAPGCTDVCLLADADRGVLQRARVTPDGVEVLDPVRVEGKVGLPPRDLTLR